MNKRDVYTLLGLFFLIVFFLAFLPAIRDAFAPVFPEGFQELDCKGVTCKEGEFCQDNVCHSVSAPATNTPVGAFS
jgi:hypothetical protein